MDASAILIVEDEAILAEALRLRIENFGYRVVGIAKTADSAIDLAGRHVPDLVLMDINLPGNAGGIEAGLGIRREHDIPVVFLTAYSDQVTLERAKAVEPFGYLTKPINNESLRTTIETALYKSRLERELRRRERWLMSTLASMHEALIAVDAEGRLVFMNPIAVELTGWTNVEALGCRVEEILVLSGGGDSLVELLAQQVEVRFPRGMVCRHRTGIEHGVVGYLTPILERDRFQGTLILFRPVAASGSRPERLTGSGRDIVCVCAWCKSGQTADDVWLGLEEFMGERFEVALSHGICPACAERLFAPGMKNPE